MKKLIFLIIACITSHVFSQNINPSKAFVRTCFNNQQCFALNEAAFIYYNENNHELSIVLDFSKLKIGNDTLDEWLEDLDDTKLIFRGNLNTDNLLILTHHNSKAIIVNGIITFNNIAHAHSIELTMFEIKENSLLYNNNSQDYYDRLSANLQFAFSPKEFKVDKKEHRLKKTISIAIYRGLINKYKPELELFYLKNN
jgi:hypothetical protein